MASEYRQEVDVTARPHEEWELRQALELSLRCPGLLYLKPATPSESESEPASESEEVKDALPFCATERSLQCPSLSNPDRTATSESVSEPRPVSEGGPPDLDLTSTSDSESVSEGAVASLPEELTADDYRQEVDVAPGHTRKGSSARP